MENRSIETHHNRVENINSLKEFCDFFELNKSNDFAKVISKFEELARGSFLKDLISFELKKINQEKFYTPIKATYNSIEVVNNASYKINLVHINSKDLLNRKFLTGFFHDKIIVSLSEKGIRYSLYKQENEIDVSILDKSKKLKVISKNAVLNYGESIFVKKHTDIFSYEGEESEESVIGLILTTKPNSSFDWEYDIETLAPYRIIGDQDDCRIEQTCRMLGQLGDPASIDVLKKLLSHSKHNVRWEAMRNLINLNFDEGVKMLKTLENDSHPEIKKAVGDTFKLIENQSK
jgi:hypothetical protein